MSYEVRICMDCLEERYDDDFMGKDTCYHCQYRAKLAIIKKHKLKCKECSKYIDCGQRWVYCCEECAYKGKIRANRKYWVNNVK